MLSIHPSSSSKSPSTPEKPSQNVTPNLLPMRISHNGPINSTSRFFAPTTTTTTISSSTSTSHVYFRGRHLQGTTVALPEGYTGAVLHVTDKQVSHTPAQIHGQGTQRGESDGEEDEEDEVGGEMEVEIRMAEQVGEFDKIVVWGHGGVVDADRDMYVRGLREWVGFAESMHCDEQED